MASATVCRDLWWTNMLLLGFDEPESHPDMFIRRNETGILSVMKFLVSVVIRRPEAIRQFLSGVWPPVDSSRRKLFRTKVVHFIEERAAKGFLPDNCVSVALLSTGHGEALYRFLWMFSTYALYAELRRNGVALPIEFGTFTVPSEPIAKLYLAAAERRHELAKTEFLSVLQESAEFHSLISSTREAVMTTWDSINERMPALSQLNHSAKQLGLSRVEESSSLLRMLVHQAEAIPKLRDSVLKCTEQLKLPSFAPTKQLDLSESTDSMVTLASQLEALGAVLRRGDHGRLLSDVLDAARTKIDVTVHTDVLQTVFGEAKTVQEKLEARATAQLKLVEGDIPHPVESGLSVKQTPLWTPSKYGFCVRRSDLIPQSVELSPIKKKLIYQAHVSTPTVDASRMETPPTLQDHEVIVVTEEQTPLPQKDDIDDFEHPPSVPDSLLPKGKATPVRSGDFDIDELLLRTQELIKHGQEAVERSMIILDSGY